MATSYLETEFNRAVSHGLSNCRRRINQEFGLILTIFVTENSNCGNATYKTKHGCMRGRVLEKPRIQNGFHKALERSVNIQFKFQLQGPNLVICGTTRLAAHFNFHHFH